MTYCCAAGLEDDSRALQAHAAPFKAACRATSSHRTKFRRLRKSSSGAPGTGALFPTVVLTFLYLIVPLYLIIPSQLIMTAPAQD